MNKLLKYCAITLLAILGAMVIHTIFSVLFEVVGNG